MNKKQHITQEWFGANERPEDAAYEERLIEAVGHGVADIETGRYVTSIDEAFAKAAQIRNAN